MSLNYAPLYAAVSEAEVKKFVEEMAGFTNPELAVKYALNGFMIERQEAVLKDLRATQDIRTTPSQGESEVAA